jgi:pSer/pThr/pTyr-binding forkhead associated (FHA) protein
MVVGDKSADRKPDICSNGGGALVTGGASQIAGAINDRAARAASREEGREMTDGKIVESPVERLVPSMLPRLEAIDWPLIGRTFYLDKPVVSIGRLVANDICLEDPFVSRYHCVIGYEDGQYVLEDLHSTNGTYVNGERINVYALAEGDLIRIGASRFEVRLQFPGASGAVRQHLCAAKDGRSQLNEITLR